LTTGEPGGEAGGREGAGSDDAAPKPFLCYFDTSVTGADVDGDGDGDVIPRRRRELRERARGAR
jgi:hypothetical protein